MKNIVIEVEGGCVRNVYADDPQIKVTLFDWDNERESDKTVDDLEAELEKLQEGKHVVF